MNSNFPDWNIGTELPSLTHKNKTFGLDGELMELLWENGQVVLHAQTHHHHNPKSGPQLEDDSRQVENQSGIRGSLFSCENPVTDLIQGTETVSWIDDEFFSEFPMDDHQPGAKSNLASLPPRFDTFVNGMSKNGACVPDKPVKQAEYLQSSNKGCGTRTRGEVGEYSVKTVASSHCGSNQVMTDAADASLVSSYGIGERGLSATVAKHNIGKMSCQSDRIQTETLGTAITSSSSGGSHSSFGRESNHSRGANSHKRKSRDVEDSECQSKEAELESAPRKKSGLKSRKSRAAEVHNLSERRRRDRINEKMRLLQELLPHSNKTDKASMLDEAIEYMKSLQQQVQMMWMGSGMAPFMFPGVQHCMSRLAMGMGALPMPPNPMHFPRLPLQVDQAAAAIPNQAAACQTNMLSKINYQNQLQNPHIPQQFANYMQFHPLQAASQQINVFTFGPKTAAHNQMPAPPGHN